MKVFSLIIAGLVIAVLLIVEATRSTASNVHSPADLAAEKTDHRRVRVVGRVTSDPIGYEHKPELKLTFRVIAVPNTPPSEPPAAGLPGTIAVVYRGIKPDMFTAGRDVIIDGDWIGGELVANNLLTQCPSKYEPPKPGEAAPQAKVVQQGETVPSSY